MSPELVVFWGLIALLTFFFVFCAPDRRDLRPPALVLSLGIALASASVLIAGCTKEQANQAATVAADAAAICPLATKLVESFDASAQVPDVCADATLIADTTIALMQPPPGPSTQGAQGPRVVDSKTLAAVLRQHGATVAKTARNAASGAWKKATGQ